MREGRVVYAGLGYVSSLRVVYAGLGYVSSLWFHAHFMFFIANHFMSFFDNDMLRLDCRDSGGSHY